MVRMRQTPCDAERAVNEFLSEFRDLAESCDIVFVISNVLIWIHLRFEVSCNRLVQIQSGERIDKGAGSKSDGSTQPAFGRLFASFSFMKFS